MLYAAAQQHFPDIMRNCAWHRRQRLQSINQRHYPAIALSLRLILTWSPSENVLRRKSKGIQKIKQGCNSEISETHNSYSRAYKLFNVKFIDYWWPLSTSLKRVIYENVAESSVCIGMVISIFIGQTGRLYGKMKLSRKSENVGLCAETVACCRLSAH